MLLTSCNGKRQIALTSTGDHAQDGYIEEKDLRMKDQKEIELPVSV